MTAPLGTVLATALSRAILVSAVLVSMKFLWDGIYPAAAGLVLTLVFFVYLSFTDARLLR